MDINEETGGPLDLDGDGKQSTQETALGIALLVVAGALAAYVLYLASTGQITQDVVTTLATIAALLTGGEGFKRLRSREEG